PFAFAVSSAPCTPDAYSLSYTTLFRSAAEVKAMAKAGRISAEAHCRAMKRARRGGHEYNLEAELIHTFMEHGARSTAYPSIVGGDRKSTRLNSSHVKISYAVFCLKKKK